MRVSDVLASKGSDAVFTIKPGESIPVLLDALAEYNIGALVVSSDDNSIIGIVSERDVVRKLKGAENAMAMTVHDIMSTQVTTAEPGDPVESILAIMTDKRVRHVPVIDEGRLVGVVSIGDVVKYRMDQLKFERDQLTQYVTGGN